MVSTEQEKVYYYYHHQQQIGDSPTWRIQPQASIAIQSQTSYPNAGKLPYKPRDSGLTYGTWIQESR